MAMVQPVPFRRDWAPNYLLARNTDNIDKAYLLRDAQGMYGGPNGSRVHGGWDIFAPGGTLVRSPVTGTVVRVYKTNDRSGPVYGGVVAIRREGGKMGVLMRHVDPRVSTGQKVRAGDVVADVTDWTDGGDHVHLEMHRDIGTGYNYYFSNSYDPGSFTWVPVGDSEIEPPPETVYGMEELPFTHTPGALGPKIYGPWSSKTKRDLVYPVLKMRHPTRAVTRVLLDRDEDKPRYAVVAWHKYGAKPVWRYSSKAGRDAMRKRREEQTGRKMRPFTGSKASLYWRLP